MPPKTKFTKHKGYVAVSMALTVGSAYLTAVRPRKVGRQGGIRGS